MQRDEQYDLLKMAFENNRIKEFSQIFNHVPKTRITRAISSNNRRVTLLISHPWLFTVEELILISNFLGLEFAQLQELVYLQYQKLKKGKRINKLPRVSRSTDRNRNT